MASFIWMFIDDNDDEFKKYQRAFRKMEVETANKKLLIEVERIKDERIIYDNNLLKADSIFATKKSILDTVRMCTNTSLIPVKCISLKNLKLH